MNKTSLHPKIDNGIEKGSTHFTGGKLICHCKTSPVEISVESQVAFNHACGCTKCWKPENSVFSIVGVVTRAKVKVTENEQNLFIIDSNATIQRHACKECGVHLFGRIENELHAFYGLDFIHTELSQEKGWEEPKFAAFVSSLIEGGLPPSAMEGVRNRLAEIKLPFYDCLSPTLMDLLATQAAKLNGVLVEE